MIFNMEGSLEKILCKCIACGEEFDSHAAFLAHRAGELGRLSRSKWRPDTRHCLTGKSLTAKLMRGLIDNKRIWRVKPAAMGVSACG